MDFEGVLDLKLKYANQITSIGVYYQCAIDILRVYIRVHFIETY